MSDKSKCLSCGAPGYPLCEECKGETYLPTDPMADDTHEVEKTTQKD